MTFTETQIKLYHLRLHGFHGMTADEQQVGSDFQIDLCMEIQADEQSFKFDDLENTVNYAEAYNIIKTMFAQTCHTLEHVCQNILEALFEHFRQITQIRIEIHKLNPPIGADCKSASVQITATRE